MNDNQDKSTSKSYQARFARILCGPHPSEVGNVAFVVRTACHALIIMLVIHYFDLQAFTPAIVATYLGLVFAILFIMAALDLD